jgi:hypothetical protein
MYGFCGPQPWNAIRNDLIVWLIHNQLTIQYVEKLEGKEIVM